MTERNNTGRIAEGVVGIPRGDSPLGGREIISSVDLSMFDGNPNIARSRRSIRPAQQNSRNNV